MEATKEPRRFEKRGCNEMRECFLQPACFAATNLRLGENIMSKRLLVALLGAGFTCATLSAQELPLDSSTNVNSAR